MKLYKELEQIFKLRLGSNNDIPAYMKRVRLIGKFDEVKKEAVLSLILTKLGELEDGPQIISGTKAFALTTLPQSNQFTCPICSKVAKNKAGLISHQKIHDK